MWLKDRMTWVGVGAPHYVSPPWGYNVFNLSGDLTKPHDLRAMWLYEKEPLKVSYLLPSMFGGYRHGGNRDTIFFVYHVISKDHVIKRSCDFIARSLSTEVTILPSLVAMNTVDHVIKGSCDFINESLSW